MNEREQAAMAVANLEAATTDAILATAEKLRELAGPRAAVAFCEYIGRQVNAYAINVKRGSN